MKSKGWSPYYEEKGITIYHGDCLDVIRTLPPRSVDMIWTDPPYGHNNHVDDLNSRLNKHRVIKDQPIKNDSQEAMREVVDGMLSEAIRVLKGEACCCCCGGGGPQPTFAWVANRLDSKGLQFFHAVVWDKLNPGLGWRYRRRYEMVMVAHQREQKLLWANDDVAVPNVIQLFTERNRLHPNEKPLELVKKFIAWHSSPDDMILDPFMVSGTTLRAAKDLGRRAIGIELEEKYCEIAVNRLRQEVMKLG